VGGAAGKQPPKRVSEPAINPRDIGGKKTPPFATGEKKLDPFRLPLDAWTTGFVRIGEPAYGSFGVAAITAAAPGTLLANMQQALILQHDRLGIAQ
jgi:hypothetical protein